MKILELEMWKVSFKTNFEQTMKYQYVIKEEQNLTIKQDIWKH